MINRIKRFFMEARQEFRQVSWPTRQEAIRLTSIVIGLSVGIALFLGMFDFIFQHLLKSIVLQ